MTEVMTFGQRMAAPPFQGWGLKWSQLVPSAWDCLGVCIVPSEILSMALAIRADPWLPRLGRPPAPWAAARPAYGGPHPSHDYFAVPGSPAIPRVGTKLVTISPQRLGLFGRLYRALRNTKYGRLLLELMTRTLGCLILAGLQHPGPLRGPPTAGPTLAMTNLPHLRAQCT